MKKGLFYILSLSVLLITSCGENAINITSEEGLISLKKLAVEQFGGDTDVIGLNFTSEEDLSDDFGHMTISYFKDDNEIYTNTYNSKIYGNEAHLEGEKKNNFIDTKYTPKWQTPEGNGKLKIKDIDFNQVLPNILEAFVLLGDDTNLAYIKNYNFKVEPKTNTVTATFRLQYTVGKNSTNLEGRRLVTNYYEARFEADAEGNITLKK